ncbi:2-dehydropantoate 2-reductase [Paenalkalicoccus suaedae]|uniref:2-dehydropantoate 2-reductase n=1 Tax=Paenalkalicoccus suaedae TaxID=2592382 RepID=A0A859FFY4_9BACI|nr:2-dehydropantoate 2-reductase [Paenalkalicoccus suaedae]QKS71534.1 2-dehydropantoate 2-reductase [Paenalkalicoccus suaedae]
MTIAVIGSGAIGLLLASYLAEDHLVQLYTRRRESANALRDGVIRYDAAQTAKAIKQVDGYVLSKVDRIEASLCIVTTKAYSIPSVIDELSSKLPKDTPVLFVQNGMAHVEIAEESFANSILATTTHGARKISENEVIHTGIGELTVEYPLQLTVPDDLHISVDPEIKKALEKKLLVNAVVNPLTTLYEVKNGDLRLFHHEEVKEIADELSAFLSIQDGTSFVDLVLNKTAANHSSMLVDYAASRKTEFDAILGYLKKRADREGVQLPAFMHMFDRVKRKLGE